MPRILKEGGPVRIVYGVHGYGQGHATRAAAILAELSQRHDVLVFAGASAYEALHGEYNVLPIPTLGYCYRRSGKRSNFLTLKRNVPGVLDLLLHGPSFQMVETRFREFDPQVVISDAEPWTHRVASHLRIPRIGFDHFGILAYCRPKMQSWSDRLVSARDAWMYETLMRRPDRVLISSFYKAPPVRAGVRVVNTLLRREVFSVTASYGRHLLAYFNQGMHVLTKPIERALRSIDCPVQIYGTKRIGQDGNLEFRPRGNRAFLESLASCRAVVSTAGNQLVGEAIHFRKPMLVMPEDCVEQRVNALAVEQVGIGMQVPRHLFSHEVLHQFLEREAQFREHLNERVGDGREEALAVLEAFIAELAPPRDTTTDGTTTTCVA